MLILEGWISCEAMKLCLHSPFQILLVIIAAEQVLNIIWIIIIIYLMERAVWIRGFGV